MQPEEPRSELQVLSVVFVSDTTSEDVLECWSAPDDPRERPLADSKLRI